MMVRFNILLNEIKSSSGTIAELKRAVDSLVSLKVIDLLRARSVPVIYENGGDVQKNASAASFAAGYNEALDNLMYFQETFLTPALQQTTPKMNFGSLDIAVEKGFLTKEEANGLRAAPR